MNRASAASTILTVLIWTQLFLPPGRAAEPRPPNVVFLNIDLLRYDFVGLLNPERRCTPNIDRFFRGGVIFDEAQATSGATFYSNGSVLTGKERFDAPRRFRHSVGVETGEPPRTLAHTLAESGYRTININQGKYSGKWAGLDAGFQDYVELPVGTLMEDAVSPLLDFLGADGEQPLFVLIRTKALHYPYLYPVGREQPAAGDISRFGAIDENKGVITFAVPLRHSIQVIPGSAGDNPEILFEVRDLKTETEHRFSRRDREVVENTYCQQLRYVDEVLARVFALLEGKRRDDTIVVLYSNHGESLSDDGIFGHGCSRQPCVHVPLMIKHPERSEPVRVPTPVSLVDLGPTLLELLGIPSSEPVAGDSFASLISGGEYVREYIYGWNRQSKYIRWKDWKLIVLASGAQELYRLSEDPREQTDLRETHRDRALLLEHELMRKEIEIVRTDRSRRD